MYVVGKIRRVLFHPTPTTSFLIPVVAADDTRFISTTSFFSTEAGCLFEVMALHDADRPRDKSNSPLLLQFPLELQFLDQLHEDHETSQRHSRARLSLLAEQFLLLFLRLFSSPNVSVRFGRRCDGALVLSP